jgi:pentatricopeptide repeat protein
VETRTLDGRFGEEPWQRSLETLRHNQSKGAFNEAIRYCREYGHWDRALRLLREMKENGTAMNSKVYDEAIRAAAKSNQWEEALKMLAQHKAPSPEAWSATVGACDRAKQDAWALGVLGEMDLRKVRRDQECLHAGLSVCAREGEWSLALRLLAELTSLKQKGKTETRTHQGEAYGLAVAAASRAGQWEVAMELLMASKGLPLGRMREEAFDLALGACARAAQWHSAFVILSDMTRTQKINPRAESYMQVIRALAADEQWKLVLSAYTSMKDRGLEPDGACHALLLKACANTGAVAEAKALWKPLVRGFTHGETLVTDADMAKDYLHVLAEAGLSREAVRTFDELPKMAVQADVACYIEVLRACESTIEEPPRWLASLAFLERLTSANPNLDLASLEEAYRSVMTACLNGQAENRAMQIFEQGREVLALRRKLELDFKPSSKSDPRTPREASADRYLPPS